MIAILAASISGLYHPDNLFCETYEVYRGGNIVGYEEVEISCLHGGEKISSESFFPFAINPKEISCEITYEGKRLDTCIREAKSLVMNSEDRYLESFIADDLEDFGSDNYAVVYDSAIGFKRFWEIKDRPDIIIFSDGLLGMIEIFRRNNLRDTDDITALVTTLSPYIFCEEVDINVDEEDSGIKIDISGKESKDFFIDALIYGKKGGDYPERVWFPNTRTLYVLADETPDLPLELSPEISSLSEIRRVEFLGGNGTKLNGVSFLPKNRDGSTASAGKFPIVVMVAGIGPHRWSYMGIYSELAEQLSRLGIASFVWDKRGCGESGESYYERTPDLLLEDIGAAIEQSLKITGSDPERLVLLGHSEGGLLSIITAATNSRVKKLVLLSSPGEPISEIFIHDARVGAKNLPLGRKEKGEYVEVYEEMFSKIEKNPKDTYLYTGCEGPSREIYLGHFKGHTKVDPRDYINDITVPVLVLHGEKDFIVGDYNSKIIFDILKDSGNMDVTLITYSDLGHNLGVAVPEGENKEISSIEIDPKVTGDILLWLKSELGIKDDTHPSP